MTSINKEEVSEELQSIVNDFNQRFSSWMETHGCRAEFAWRYGTERSQVKSMDIQAIDLIVYRKTPPQFELMKEKLNSPS